MNSSIRWFHRWRRKNLEELVQVAIRTSLSGVELKRCKHASIGRTTRLHPKKCWSWGETWVERCHFWTWLRSVKSLSEKLSTLVLKCTKNVINSPTIPDMSSMNWLLKLSNNLDPTRRPCPLFKALTYGPMQSPLWLETFLLYRATGGDLTKWVCSILTKNNNL